MPFAVEAVECMPSGIVWDPDAPLARQTTYRAELLRRRRSSEFKALWRSFDEGTPVDVRGPKGEHYGGHVTEVHFVQGLTQARFVLRLLPKAA